MTTTRMRKTRYSTIGTLFFTIIIIASAIGSAYTIQSKHQLSADNQMSSTLYVGGNGPDNYTSIQSAIDHATPGDSIIAYAESSPYYETLTINKSLYLIGENKHTTIIDGAEQDNVITITADSVKITGFCIQNGSKSYGTAGIVVDTAHSVTIADTIIQEEKKQTIGILIRDADTISIQNTSFLNTKYGIYAQQASQLNMQSNQFISNHQAIYFVSVSGSKVSNNQIQESESGIELFDTTASTITHNTLHNNDVGMILIQSHANHFSQNVIVNNEWYGLWLINSTDNTLVANHFRKNIDIGLYLKQATDNIISENIFENNDDGIYLEDSSENRIENNIFQNLKLNAYFVAHTLHHCRNKWINNYWGRPKVFPQIILGRLKRDLHFFNCFNLDMRPMKRLPDTQVSCIQILQGKTYFVGGTGPGNFSRIQAAIDNASDGDAVFIYQGIYEESIIIDKSLTITGEHKQLTILDGVGKYDIISIVADAVEINNCCIRNGHFGIAIFNTSHHLIRDTILDNNLHGISLQPGCRSIMILRNNFSDNVYGMRLYESSWITVSYNYFDSYKLDAFFIGANTGECNNIWRRNYWTRPKMLPHIIFGKRIIHSISIPWFDFDWNPRMFPNLPTSSEYTLKQESFYY